jgi:hypothetical protein
MVLWFSLWNSCFLRLSVAKSGNMFAGVVLHTSFQGTNNVYNDVDKGWSLEIAIPWASLSMCMMAKT